jgi:hypothetical protein
LESNFTETPSSSATGAVGLTQAIPWRRFPDIRHAEFGAADSRTLADFRRSGAVEAIAGGARAEELAHAMGNTLSASNALFSTYVPINQATLRTVLEARRRGRMKLR